MTANLKVPVPVPAALLSSTSTVQVPVLFNPHDTLVAGDAQTDVPVGPKKSMSGASVPVNEASVAVSVLPDLPEKSKQATSPA